MCILFQVRQQIFMSLKVEQTGRHVNQNHQITQRTSMQISACQILQPKKLSKQCRICLQNEQQASGQKIIRTCKCTGSLKFVHEQCIKHWIQTQIRSLSSQQKQELQKQGIQCQLCKFNIRFQLLSKYHCNGCQILYNQIASNRKIWYGTLLIFVGSILLIPLCAYFMVAIFRQHGGVYKNSVLNIQFFGALFGLILLSIFVMASLYLLITLFFISKTQIISKIKQFEYIDIFIRTKSKIIPVEEISDNIENLQVRSV